MFWPSFSHGSSSSDDTGFTLQAFETSKNVGRDLTLAVVGIYGLMSFAGSQRTPEIGVRMALGAQRRDILAMMASRRLPILAVGVTIGSIAELSVGRMVGGFLVNIAPTDPATFVGVSVFLMLVTVIRFYSCAPRSQGRPHHGVAVRVIPLFPPNISLVSEVHSLKSMPMRSPDGRANAFAIYHPTELVVSAVLRCRHKPFTVLDRSDQRIGSRTRNTI